MRRKYTRGRGKSKWGKEIKEGKARGKSSEVQLVLEREELVSMMQDSLTSFAMEMGLRIAQCLLEDEVDLARQRGHTHLNDLLEFLRACPDVLQNPHIVLKHFSMRYTRKTIVSVLKERLPPEFLERVHILV